MFRFISAVIITCVIFFNGPTLESAAFDSPPGALEGNNVISISENSSSDEAEVTGESSPRTTSEGKPEDTSELRQRIIDLQNKGKLGFRKVIACSSVDGYGLYSPVEPDKPFSRIIFYVEPSNVNTLVSGDRYIIDCSVDVFVTDARGKGVAGKEGAYKINKVSRSPVLDLYFKLDINFSKPVTRDIVVKIVVRDNLKNETAAVSQRINLASSTTKESSLPRHNETTGNIFSSVVNTFPVLF